MTERGRWGSVKPAATFIGSVLKHLKNRDRERKEIHKIFQQFRQNSQDTFKDIEDEQVNGFDREFFIRKRSVAMTPKVSRHSSMDHFQEITKKRDMEHCFECDKLMFSHRETLHPCRVCQRVFHKDCVMTKKDIHENDKLTIDRANTNTGWSCYLCSDISLLLTDSEIAELTSDFDRFHLKADSTISVADYCRYRSGLSGEFNDDITHLEYKLMDLDGDGTISWFEFLHHETKRVLAKRTQDELVTLLTDKEVAAARAVFDHMDTDHDGKITQSDTDMAYKSWYRRFRQEPRRKYSTTINHHADYATNLIMENDSHKQGSVSWEEYLSGQALYIVCTRTNIV